MDLSAYRELWRTRGVFALLTSAILARLPVIAAMVPVSFLAKDAAGNFGWAGIVAGTYSVGMALGGPVWARVADRRGARTVVIALGVAWSVAMTVLALLPSEWYRLMPVVSGLAGVFVAPVTAIQRAAWVRIVHGPRLRAVYALDATAAEVLFAIAPMLGALVVSFASPRAGVLGAAVGAAITVWWFGLLQPSAAQHVPAKGARLTAPQLLWHRYRAPMILSFAFCVTAFASVSLGIVAFADAHGNRLIAGVLETVWAVGSLAGGVLVGALPGRRRSYVWRRAVLVSAGMLLCVFATWSPVSLGIALLLSGLALAPTVGALYERLGAMTPDSVKTEVFGWMGSAGMAGGAVGSAVAGLVVEAFGVRYVWVMAAVLTLAAAVSLLHIPPHQPSETEADLPAELQPVV
jgi:MFS family permease